jgi:glycosyltransferase involved in cell wall biosynthesis
MRVTLGIATFNRDTYLAAAIESGLDQDLTDAFEVLVVVDGSTNPAIDAVLDGFAGDPRLRVVRHDRNLGIAAAYNTFISDVRGELIAMLGDDDLCLPGRLRRQVEIFDRYPDTGVVHGDAIVIDADGRRTGAWISRDFSRSALARQIDRLALEPGLLERLQGEIGAPPTFSAYVDELERRYHGEETRAGHSRAPRGVRWQGDFGKPTSLSIINDRISERLAGPVQRIDVTGAAIDPPLPHPAAVEVRHSWPPNLTRPAAGRLAAIVPWEFGAVPREWVGEIRENVDELWVPSAFVRNMYVAAGIEKVVVIPNGVDLEVFRPRGTHAELPAGIRFLFVGGLIWRKGSDILLRAYREAFAGRDDVVLVVKDVGKDGVYRGADRGEIAALAAADELPRIHLIDADLTTEDIAAVYRACDVLVHPYRSEGFAMPVLEAMACGQPVITTEGGPTDEFCPPEAGWRIRSRRVRFPDERVDTLPTAGRP